MVLVAYAIAVSSVLFQTITHNRILTPAIMGFDALYILIQAIIVFAFGMNGIADWSPAWKFLFEVALMTTFASFNSIRTELFLVSALTVAAASVIGWRLRRIYDVVALGRYPHTSGRTTAKDEHHIQQAIRYLNLDGLADRYLDELGKTVVVVLHDINFASCYSDYIVGMRDGKVVFQGSPRELITPKTLKELYDLDVTIHTISGQHICVHYT